LALFAIKTLDEIEDKKPQFEEAVEELKKMELNPETFGYEEKGNIQQKVLLLGLTVTSLIEQYKKIKAKIEGLPKHIIPPDNPSRN